MNTNDPRFHSPLEFKKHTSLVWVIHLKILVIVLWGYEIEAPFMARRLLNVVYIQIWEVIKQSLGVVGLWPLTIHLEQVLLIFVRERHTAHAGANLYHNVFSQCLGLIVDKEFVLSFRLFGTWFFFVMSLKTQDCNLAPFLDRTCNETFRPFFLFEFPGSVLQGQNLTISVLWNSVSLWIISLVIKVENDHLVSTIAYEFLTVMVKLHRVYEA